MQSLIAARLIEAGHDRTSSVLHFFFLSIIAFVLCPGLGITGSDGGLITTILEMAFAGNWYRLVVLACSMFSFVCAMHSGVDVTITSAHEQDEIAFFFNEEIGNFSCFEPGSDGS